RRNLDSLASSPAITRSIMKASGFKARTVRGHIRILSFCVIATSALFLAALVRGADAASAPVTITETDSSFTLSNGLVSARIEKRSGTLVSLTCQGLELMAQGRGGSVGGYWSSVGRGRPGSQ